MLTRVGCLEREMATEWFYAKGDKQHGPVTGEMLKSLAQSGKLLPSDLVWNETLNDWTPSASLSGITFATAVARVPPPLPPSSRPLQPQHRQPSASQPPKSHAAPSISTSKQTRHIAKRKSDYDVVITLVCTLVFGGMAGLVVFYGVIQPMYMNSRRDASVIDQKSPAKNPSTSFSDVAGKQFNSETDAFQPTISMDLGTVSCDCHDSQIGLEFDTGSGFYKILFLHDIKPPWHLTVTKPELVKLHKNLLSLKEQFATVSGPASAEYTFPTLSIGDGLWGAKMFRLDNEKRQLTGVVTFHDEHTIRNAVYALCSLRSHSYGDGSPDQLKRFIELIEKAIA